MPVTLTILKAIVAYATIAISIHPSTGAVVYDSYRCDPTNTKTPNIEEQPTKNLGVPWHFHVTGDRPGWVEFTPFKEKQHDDLAVQVDLSYKGEGIVLWRGDKTRYFLYEISTYEEGPPHGPLVSTYWTIPYYHDSCHIPLTSNQNFNLVAATELIKINPPN